MQLEESKKFLDRTRAQVLETGDSTSKLSAWKYRNNQAPIIGTDADEDGKLYLTISDETPGAGQARIQVFKESGKTTEVLRGTGSDSGTVNLFPQNNQFSGFTGTATTVVMASITASITTIIYENFIDTRKRVLDVFNDTEFEAKAASSFYNSIDDAVSSIDGAQSAIITAFEEWALQDLKQELKSGATSFVIHEETSSDGAVTLTTRGLIADLDDAMDDDSVGSQTVLKITTSNTSAAFDGDNAGSGTITTLTVKEYALDGFFEANCVVETIGREEFSCTIARSDTNDTIPAQRRARVAKAWKSGDLGVEFTIDRVITDSGTSAGDFATWAFAGETSTNTNDGVLYASMDSSGTFHSLTLFSAITRNASEKVAQGTRTGNGAITITTAGGSGLTGSVTLTFTADTSDLVVKLNVFKKDDRFNFTITNNFDARINEFLSKNYSFALRSLASPTIDDSFATVSSLPPYETREN